MTPDILSARELAYHSWLWWQSHRDELRDRREFSLARGEGALCQSLETAHHLAAHRAQRAREEFERIKEISP